MSDSNKPNKLKVEVCITETEEFSRILAILGRIITDERIDKQIRIEYLGELLSSRGR